jgi:hypothetical protein
MKTDLHVTSWVIAIILFIVALVVTNPKVVHMILRLFYLIVIITGVALFITGMDLNEGMLYGLKLLSGILIIGMMEMTLVKKKKGKPYTMFLVLFLIFFLAALYLGFKLPLTF